MEARDVAQKEVLFTVHNHHVKSCGKPPKEVDDIEDPDVYRGYFENALDEQMVFIHHRGDPGGVLFSGDAGWEKAFEVIDGKPKNLILSTSEAVWLTACWASIRMRLPKEADDERA